MGLNDRNLNVSPNCLMFLIDETGHEELADPNYPVFDVGGCAIVAAQMENVIRAPWRALKAQHFGGADVPLHAADLKNPSKEQLEALSAFFQTQRFGRFAAIVTSATKLSPTLKPYDVIPGVTRSRWQALASQQKPAPDSVAFIHEASERGDELLKRYFGITEYRLDGKLMPAEHCLMPKAAGYEALEVADFIIQAAGNEALRRARGGRVPRRDAEAVFHVDQTLVSFFAIDSAELNNQSSAKTS